MATIYHQVLIQADEHTVFEAITTQQGLSKWWIADCNVKPEVGFVNEFHMEGHGTNRMKVTALNPPTSVEWECLNVNDAWTGTRISFHLSRRGDYTCLDFKQSGYQSEDEVYATCNFHWARHLIMLKALCETGISMLDKEQERSEVKAVHVEGTS
ncbi:SRPBCC domain-containing protein [uncultured Pontibacter sp.]|uniref:SRPBCC family protein n=1 Tax=uncultured Pontibacter sp. TaxID=453356 RepID=UPI00260D3091|nr:SRPBCC domain-containing protein [uncultured Pontibacter sp.]